MSSITCPGELQGSVVVVVNLVLTSGSQKWYRQQEGRGSLYYLTGYTVTTRMISALRWAGDVDRFTVSLIVQGNLSHETVLINHNFLKRTVR